MRRLHFFGGAKKEHFVLRDRTLRFIFQNASFCGLYNGLNPCQESDRMKAANNIADMADSIADSIGRFQWDIAVTRIGQLASEMRLATGGQSVGGSNGNADELTNWDGTKKRGIGI